MEKKEYSIWKMGSSLTMAPIKRTLSETYEPGNMSNVCYQSFPPCVAVTAEFQVSTAAVIDFFP